jgi:outer membrane protein OmpA-like peptidoglycan-associated protein
MYIVDPGMGAPGAVRMQLGLDVYSGNSFLYEGDNVEQDRQFITASWTAIDILEIYASVQNRATVADQPAQQSLHALGDTGLGVKVGTRLGSLLRVGGDARLLVQNDIGNEGSLLDATSIGLRGSVALDLQGLEHPLPLIARLNGDYYFDNSAKVLADTEDARYDALKNPADRSDETRNLITRVERFGLGVNRVDMFTIGVGVEVPLELTDNFFLHPMVDWRIGMPVNRQGYGCAFHGSDSKRGTNAPKADDTCLDDAGFSAWPMSLAVGARVVPPVRGLSVLLGADFALSGSSTFVRELAPVPPFRMLIGLSYDYDARPQPKAVAAPAAPLPPPPPPPAPVGKLFGQVGDQASGQPIAGAIVRIVGSERTRLATDESGRFVAEGLAPGGVELELSHADYEPRRCATIIPPTGGEFTLSCTLAALPLTGSVKLSLHDQYGAAVGGARVQITGPNSSAAVSDPNGEASALGLPAGDYTARIESDLHLLRVLRFAVDKRQQARLEVALLRKSATPDVQVRGKEIRTNKLKFAADSAVLSPEAAQSVAELADLMLRDATLRRVRIQGDGGDALALTRALTIKQRLVDAGVPDTRLEAVAEPAKKVTLTVIE